MTKILKNETKKIISTVAFLLVIFLMQNADAQIPERYPGDFRDGVNPNISIENIDDHKEWAFNAKAILERGLESVREESFSKKRSSFRLLIERALDTSNSLVDELPMRSVLRRARNFDDLVLAQSSSAEGYSFAVSMLEASIITAIELYPAEEDFLNSLPQVSGEATMDPVPYLSFAALGMDNSRMVLDHLARSPSVDTRLAILKETLGYLFSDIERDIALRRPMASHLIDIDLLARQVGILDEDGKTVRTRVWLASLSHLNIDEKLSIARQIEGEIRDVLETDKTAVKSLIGGGPASNVTDRRFVIGN